MADTDRTLYTRIAQTNVMPDGMLSEVSYGDYALMMVVKDRPPDVKKDKQNDSPKNLR